MSGQTSVVPRSLVGCAGGVVNRQDVATNTLLLFVNFLNVQRESYGECILLGEDSGGSHPRKQSLFTWNLEQAVLTTRKKETVNKE
jgi:hypothetical protein